ncbi:MAG: 2-succinyl-6-hydroxy-2,4-cyclohexadiene-1-carboxylate synthase [Chloroflexi bacterium]|nr:MAG: 2-succinyl-6-hydroxy-2,4-cyclohexadiene-1-carboxylate synthase [Chloroflexota bacterium]
MIVQVNGIKLGVEQRGEARKSAPTLVMLHGFTGSAVGWGLHLDTLAAYDLRVIALDLPGHGQSDAPKDPQRYSIEHCQQDILAVLQQLGVSKDQAILLGYSMGGRIALYTAFSAFFRALILESASPGLADPAECEQRRLSDEALAASIERDGVPAFIERWENLPLFASQKTLSFDCREKLHKQRLQNSATGLAQSLRGVGTGVQPPLYAQLPTLNIPVLLIAGELDAKFTTIARHMAQTLPQSQLHIIPAAGHTVHLEQPQAFASLVGNFVKCTCKACPQRRSLQHGCHPSLRSG